MHTLTVSGVRWTAWLLIAGGATFMVGAVLWRMAYQAPEAESLPTIGRDHARWMWIHVWMVLGVIMTTVAFAGLRELLCDSGERLFSTLALALYSLGAALGLGWLTFRLTVHAVGFLALFGGPFAPPFWAHVVTFALGVALLRR